MRKIERYFFFPSPMQKFLAFALLPISLLYCMVATLKRKISRHYDFGIPIISVGNLVLGGSGKSPFVMEITRDYPNACVILRGYGRKSKGLKVVSVLGAIQENVTNAGEEAIMLARALNNASVIVGAWCASGVFGRWIPLQL